jgi:hypothetical protein
MELLGIRHALTRIRLEYTHVPAMRLTRPQIQRLLNLPSDACEVALAALIQSRFLCVDAEGSYRRSGTAPGTGASGPAASRTAPAISRLD